MKRFQVLCVVIFFFCLFTTSLAQEEEWGNNWVVTTEARGKCIVKGWVVRDLPGGGQSATPTEVDVLASQNQPMTSATFGYSTMGAAYTPLGGSFIPLLAEIDLSMEVKTTFRWQGTGTAPTTLKLSLFSVSSGAARDFPVVSVSNGLGHPPVNLINTFFTLSMRSSGNRYREFNVRNGAVTVKTTISSKASGYNDVIAAVNFLASEAPWAALITSDRGETFRRVEVNGVPKRVSNFLEDDEVTARGGDGVFYGDSVITSPSIWNGNDWDFKSSMHASLLGPWSYSTSGSFGGNPTLGSSGGSWDNLSNFTQIGANRLVDLGQDAMPATKKTFYAWLEASDSGEGISDFCTYIMTAHLGLEHEVLKGKTTDNRLYLAHETFPEYPNSSAYEPDRLKTVTAGNNPTTATCTQTVSSQAEDGWELSVGGGSEVSIEVIKILFNNQYKIIRKAVYSFTESTAVAVTVPPNTHVAFWNVPRGTVSKYTAERYNFSGYAGDTVEFILTGYHDDLTVTDGPANQEPRKP